MKTRSEHMPVGQPEGWVLNASSIGCTAKSILESQTGIDGQVHSVFDAAVNVTVNGGLVSLVRDPRRGPLNLVLNTHLGPQGLLALGLRVGDPVRLEKSSLEFENGTVVNFGSAETYWSLTKLSAPLLGTKEVRRNIEVAREAALTHGNLVGIGGLLTLLSAACAPAREASANIFIRASRPHFADLMRLLRSDVDSPKVGESMRLLIGLGPGLTPSADDALAGLVLMLALFSGSTGSRASVARTAARALAREAVGRTTRLSEEYLKQAALGRGSEPVMNLCNALLVEGPASVYSAAREVLSMGASSGTDTLFGVILGGMLCADVDTSGLEEGR